MDLSPSFLPHQTALAGSQPSRPSGPSDAATPLSAQAATANVAFYFRNWPFPVDAAEQVVSDVGHRSWQEKLASYREASRALIAEKAHAENTSAGQRDAWSDFAPTIETPSKPFAELIVHDTEADPMTTGAEAASADTTEDKTSF